MNNKNIPQSFKYAIQGFKTAFLNEFKIRLHCVIVLVVVTGGLLLNLSILEWISVVISMGIVLITELINTSIETLSDTLHPNVSEGIKNTKDIAASAVLIASTTALTIGLIVFIPYLCHYFKI
jgi:diacylglycerol kinase